MELPDIASVLFQFEGTTAAKAAVKLIGIRGYPRDNKLGIYDDLIGRVIGDEVSFFRASTDPGAYYIEHPLNPQGCAQLQAGLWLYQPGLHRGHHALVQAEPVTVDRIDSNGKKNTQESGWFGVNIHSGGAEDDVGRFSAGCQVIHAPEGAWGETWLSFYDPVVAAMAIYQQHKLPYLLTTHLKAKQA